LSPLYTWLLVLGLVTLGGVSSVWFYRVRRYMILRMKQVAVALENWLRPRDKLYTYLGYLVGFKAEYTSPQLRGVTKAWALYTQPPRHVLLYLPVIRLLGARERLEVTLRLASMRVDGEVHLYAPWDRATRREVSRDTAPGGYRVEEAILGGRRYLVLYRGGLRAVEEAKRVAEAVSAAGARVLRVTIHPRLRALHVAIEPTGRLDEVLREIGGAVPRLSG